MKVKEKKCRGLGKAVGSGCGKLTMWRKYGLCNACYIQFLLNTTVGMEIVAKTRLKASSKVKKEKATQSREYKEAHKSIAKLKQEARKVFQLWIRTRDANLRCVSCGKDSETWDASHFYKAELYSGLVFDERNVHSCCVYCNKHLDGNLSEYRKRLVNRFGKDWMDNLDEDAIRLRQYKFERSELINIKNKYKLKLKNNDFENEL